ncbi:MAG: asparaginase, partial [Prevotellaceae bacterium]|nr:asparaginase [Prevotellaceae bacterium]
MKILVIYTGGTIGMKQNTRTGALEPFDFAQIEEEVPELNKFGFVLDTVSFNPIDSAEVTPAFWVQLVETIADNYYKYNGFVILHGTDTMAYSASALSFMLQNLGKPVIFTGSQLPIGMLRTDGKENLISAIETAASQKDGKPTVPEVCIYFQNKLLRGNRTTKSSAEHFNAFNSFNYPPLAEAGISLKFNQQAIMPYPAYDNLIAHTNLDTSTAVLKIFPGISRPLIESISGIQGLRSLIIETFGSGNAPSFPWFIDSIKQLTDRGIIVLNIIQCLRGEVDPEKYTTGRQLKKAGVVSGKDITFEAALTKLFYLQGKY